MKKKALGLLLLFAMLVTAIPVSVAADAHPKATAQTDYYDLQQLYVTDGLVAHFTTFSKNASTVSLSNGTWTDIVKGAKATFGNSKYWEVRGNGAVGFDILYGRLEENGSITVAADTASPLETDRYSSETASSYASTRLDLGIALLPKDNYTVEYVAKYNPVYVANPDGTVARDSSGAPMEFYTKMGHGLKNANLAGAQDALGFFSSWATERDGTYNLTLNARGAVFWMLSETLPDTWNSGDAWIGYAPDGSGGMRGDFQIKDKVHTYAITREEKLTLKDKARTVTANYSLVRDGVLYKKSVTVSSASTQPGKIYFDKDDTGSFYLSSQQPTDFYAVRVYNRVLTTEELAQNRLADLLLFYDIKIPTAVLSREALMDIVYRDVQDAGFVSDALEKEAIRAEIQATLDDGEGLIDTFASFYAAQENLKEVFTTYVRSTVDIKGGKWYSLLSDSFASFGSVSRWSIGENGSVGFNTFCGAMETGGIYDHTITTNNNFKDTAAKLEFGLQLLPKDDFTVEYLAMYKPLYAYSAREKDHVARDEDGVPYEVYDLLPENDKEGGLGLHVERTTIDQLGWFSSFSTQIDGVGSSPTGWGKLNRGYIFWYFNCPTWYYNPTGQTGWGHNQNILVDGRRRVIDDEVRWMPMSDLGLNISTDAYQQNDVVRIYSISLDETLTIKEGKRVTTGLFSLYRDATLYNSNKGDLNTTETDTGKEGVGKLVYTDIDTEIDAGDFYLSATRPTDFFTVRIYDKALSEKEMLQNRAVDLLYYYGVEIPEGLKGNAATLVAIGEELSQMPFSRDAVECAANKAILENKLQEKSATVSIVLDGKTVDTISFFGGKLALPMTVQGKQVISWSVPGYDKSMKPGATVTVSNGAKITPVLLSPPEIKIEPTVRMVEKEEDLGVRFAVAVSRTDYEKLKAAYGEKNISYGLLVTPASYVQKAGAFTREALTAYASTSKEKEKPGYIQINASALYEKDESTYLVRGSIYAFTEITLKNNPSFAAISFFDVDTNGDGKVDLTLYGNYDPSANARIKETLAASKDGFSDLQKSWIDNLLSRFGA